MKLPRREPLRKRLSRLHPEALAPIARLMEAIRDEKLPFVVFETDRGHARQLSYWAKGRLFTGSPLNKDSWWVNDLGRKVTNAFAGESPHEWGAAADFILDLPDVHPWDPNHVFPEKWERLGRLARAQGLVWGGDFEGWKDRPHVELAGWRDLRPRDHRKVVRDYLSSR